MWACLKKNPTHHEKRFLIPNKLSRYHPVNNRSSASESDSVKVKLFGTNSCSDAVHIAEQGRIKSRNVSDMLKLSWRRCRLRPAARMVCCVMLAPMLLVMLYMPLLPNMLTRQAALLDWSYNTSRNMAVYALPDNNTAILEPQHVCRKNLFLLVVVCSSIQNFVTRQNIRETWGNTKQFNYGMFKKLHRRFNGQYLDPTPERLQYFSEYLNLSINDTTIVPAIIPVKVYFLLGRPRSDDYVANETMTLIRTEYEQYGDIIQENFIDTYNNLTLKSVLALKWMIHRCSHRSAFFMKADDDTFLNLPNLLHYLLGGTLPIYNETIHLYDTRTYRVLSPRNRFNITTNYLGGHLFCFSRPVSEVRNKWYMPYYMYPSDRYPRYLSGSAYVMSADVVPRLYEAALNTTFIHIEDVYLTGMCAEKIHLARHHSALFSYARAKDWCSFRGSITQHEVKDESMMDAYSYVTNTSLYCAPPAKYMTKRLHKQQGCE